MPRVTPLISSVNAGEFSPRMAARTDFAKYPNAARTLENFLPWPQGGASRRTGTRYVAAMGDESKKPRLLPFEFSIVQAYVIEAGEGYLRFYRDNGQIVVAGTDAAITNGTFASDISGWTDASTGAGSISHDATNQRLNLNGASGETAWAEQAVTTTDTGQEHVLRFVVLGAHGDTVELRIGTSSTGNEIVDDVAFAVGHHCYAFTPSASPFYVQFRNGAAKAVQIDDVQLLDDAPVEVGAPWTEAQLPDIQFAQTADLMYVSHPDWPIFKIARSGHSSWSVVEVDFVDGPYLEANTDSGKTLQPSAASGLGITITASGHEPFAATDVGRLVGIQIGATWGYAVITAFNSATQVVADVRSDFGGATADADWRLGAWSGTAGYPACCTFYEQRFYAASTTEQPQTLWGSRSAALEDFAPGADDDDPVTYSIAADQVNVIEWLSPGDVLAAGTAGGEWIVRASVRDDPITPTNIQIKRHSTIGSASIAARRIGRDVLYVQRAGRKVMSFAFSFDADGFQSSDMTILADHVTESGVVQMDWAQEPDSVLWCVRDDGVLATLTFQRDQSVIGWSRQILGGSFGGGDAVVESVAVIPGSSRDEVWVAVKRTIDGQTRRYVEYFEEDADEAASQADVFYLDSGATYDGAPATVISGLDHLEGETVQALADGAYAGEFTVMGGAITLKEAAGTVQVGLGYTSSYESLKLDYAPQPGTGVGRAKKIDGVTLVLEGSLGGRAGVRSDPGSAGGSAEASRLETIKYRQVSDLMDAAPPLFTGEKHLKVAGNYDPDQRIIVRQSEPFPLNVLAIIPGVDTKETRR